MHLRILGIRRNARGNQFRGSGIEDGREKLVLPRVSRVGKGRGHDARGGGERCGPPKYRRRDGRGSGIILTQDDTRQAPPPPSTLSSTVDLRRLSSDKVTPEARGDLSESRRALHAFEFHAKFGQFRRAPRTLWARACSRGPASLFFPLPSFPIVVVVVVSDTTGTGVSSIPKISAPRRRIIGDRRDAKAARRGHGRRIERSRGALHTQVFALRSRSAFHADQCPGKSSLSRGPPAREGPAQSAQRHRCIAPVTPSTA